MGSRTFSPDETAEVIGALSIHDCPIIDPARATILGRNAIYDAPGAAKPAGGPISVPPGARVTQVRHREHRRVSPRGDLGLRLEVALPGAAPVQVEIVDLGFGGLSFDPAPIARAGRLADFAPGRRVELEVSWSDASELREVGESAAPPDRRVRLTGRVAVVRESGAGVAVEAGAEDRGAWRLLLSAHLYAHTRVGREWSQRVFRVLDEMYLVRWNPPGPTDEDKRRHEAWHAKLAHDVVRVVEIAEELHAGHSVVFEDARGPLGTIAFISLFDGTWSGHQIGVAPALAGRKSSARRMEVLRKVYDHGFELTQLGDGARRIAGYCTAAHVWLLDTHFAFTRDLSEDEGYSLPLRMFHLELEASGEAPAPDPRWTLALADEVESIDPLFVALRTEGLARRPRIYREALGLTFESWKRHEGRIASEVGEKLEVKRTALLAYDVEDRPVACAVLDAARAGTNVLGLFDIVHLYPLVPLPEEASESVFGLLLSTACAWFRDVLGKSTLHYVIEEPERLSAPDPWVEAKGLPPHLAGLEPQGVRVRDLGLGFYWIIDELKTQDFMEHVFLKTAVAPADGTSGSTKP